MSEDYLQVSLDSPSFFGGRPVDFLLRLNHRVSALVYELFKGFDQIGSIWKRMEKFEEIEAKAIEFIFQRKFEQLLDRAALRL